MTIASVNGPGSSIVYETRFLSHNGVTVNGTYYPPRSESWSNGLVVPVVGDPDYPTSGGGLILRQYYLKAVFSGGWARYLYNPSNILTPAPWSETYAISHFSSSGVNFAVGSGFVRQSDTAVDVLNLFFTDDSNAIYNLNHTTGGSYVSYVDPPPYTEVLITDIGSEKLVVSQLTKFSMFTYNAWWTHPYTGLVYTTPMFCVIVKDLVLVYGALNNTLKTYYFLFEYNGVSVPWAKQSYILAGTGTETNMQMFSDRRFELYLRDNSVVKYIPPESEYRLGRTFSDSTRIATLFTTGATGTWESGLNSTSAIADPGLSHPYYGLQVCDAAGEDLRLLFSRNYFQYADFEISLSYASTYTVSYPELLGDYVFAVVYPQGAAFPGYTAVVTGADINGLCTIEPSISIRNDWNTGSPTTFFVKVFRRGFTL